MKQWVIGVVVAAVLMVPRAAPAQARGWAPPDCELSTGHYLVNSAALYLKNAATTRFKDQTERDLRDARRVLFQALEQGQGENAAVWYFLGRYYAEVDDIPGMDSAFDHAAALAPHCLTDIRTHRRQLWVPILNAGVDRLKAGDTDAAATAFHRANEIYDAEPPGFFYMGRIFADKGEQDSALVYFRRAIETAADSANLSNEGYQALRADAIFNVASMYHIAEQHDSAVAWYSRYRELKPDDPQGRTRLADALEGAGRPDEALALYDSVLLGSDSMPTLDLFQTGVAMFQAKRFERAVQAFEAGLQRNPYYRDALFNLANTYLSLANESDSLEGPAVAARKKELGEKMLPVTNRLVEADPMSVAARRLKAAAFQLQNAQDSTLAVLEGIEAMPFEVTVSQFTPQGSGHQVRGILTNLQDSAATIPPLVFEFVNEAGEVVQTLTVESQQIEEGGVAPFNLAPLGEGIAAWRYKVES